MPVGDFCVVPKLNSPQNSVIAIPPLFSYSVAAPEAREEGLQQLVKIPAQRAGLCNWASVRGQNRGLVLISAPVVRNAFLPTNVSHSHACKCLAARKAINQRKNFCGQRPRKMILSGIAHFLTPFTERGFPCSPLNGTISLQR